MSGRFGRLLQQNSKITGDFNGPRGVIGSLPTPVSFSRFNLFVPPRLHPTVANQLLGNSAVDLGPSTSGASRRELDQIVSIIILIDQTIDPSITNRCLSSLFVINRLLARLFFCDLQPDALTAGLSVALEPSLHASWRLEQMNRKSLVFLSSHESASSQRRLSDRSVLKINTHDRWRRQFLA